MRQTWWSGAAGIAGLVCVGLPASGLATAAPEAVRVLATLAGVLVLPAIVFLPLARGFHRGAEEDTGSVLALSFLLGLSALAVWTECFVRAGSSFGLYADVSTWVLLILFAAHTLAARRRRDTGPDRPDPTRKTTALSWLALLGLCALFAALVPPSLTSSEDGLDHIGYVRRAMTLDTMRPDGILAWPSDAVGALPPDPRKGALHPVLALIASISQADPVSVWRWLAVVMFPAAVLSFLSFSRVFLKTTRALAACAALFLLSYSGDAFQLVGASAYGQNLAADWCWVLLPAATALSRRGPSAARLGVIALLVMGGVFVHLGVFLHAVVLAATLALFGGWLGLERSKRAVAALALATFAGLSLWLRITGGVPAANAIHAHPQGVLFLSQRLFIASPLEVLRQHGMVFLGGIVLLPVLVPAARSRADARAILAVSVLPMAAAFTPAAVWLFERGSYMVFRALLNAPVFPAVVVTVSWVVTRARANAPAGRALGAAFLTIWALAFVRPALDAWSLDARGAWTGARSRPLVSRELVDIVAALPAGRTILSDPATSYVLSAYTPHRFVALIQQHGNPYDPHDLDRLRSVRDVLSPNATTDLALAACGRYRVDYVVVNDGREEGASDFLSVWDAGAYDTAVARLMSMPASFVPVDSGGGGTVFRFDPGAPANRAWPGADPPVVVESSHLQPCELEAPNGAFRVTGMAVHPLRALPGDTVTVTLGYRHDQPSPFALPMLIHFRFDHESIATARRYPGEKHVRRAAERRANSFVRFRADFRPGHGAFDPDLWPIGADLCERFRVVVPRHARLGRYRVEVRVVEDSLLPNFHAADLLFNRDHYSGTTCAELTVSDRVIGIEGAP